MSDQRIVIIGGGLAGLSAGCYALMNGWKTTIVEHNLALGGVCAAWQRGPYTIDGCIHWLTGGPFMRIYEELGIIPPVEVRTINHFLTYRNVATGARAEIHGNFDALRDEFCRVGPDDIDEIDRIIDAADRVAEMSPEIDRPRELSTVRDRLRSLWDKRGELGTLLHFRKNVGDYTQHHIRSATLRSLLLNLVPAEAPAFFLLFLIGYLAKGRLSRPVGGTAAFRDALIERYNRLGGETLTNSTVEEVVVKEDRACGVRLTDGTLIDGDIVVSTASSPETVLRLLAGQYGADRLRHRLEHWKLFEPIALLSYGVARTFSGEPAMLRLDGLEGFKVGERENPQVTLRIFNDEPSVAPEGHTVVQLLASTDYDWWGERGMRYGAEKDAVAQAGLTLLDRYLPGIADAVRMTDVATPLTFWRNARSWRGAFEGWMPTPDTFFAHVDKALPGLSGFFMAGQWVEPGGGVPTALMSGRQLVQILCDNEGKEFLHRAEVAAGV